MLRRATSLLLLILAVCAVFLATACGDDDDGDSGFAGAEGRLREILPRAEEFMGDVIVHGGSEDEVNIVISSDLAGSPRLHVISDTDAVANGEFIEEVDGVSYYLTSQTYWADISGDTPLFVSAAQREGVEAYVNFYDSGQPEFSDQRFWTLYDFAQERLREDLGTDPTLIRITYERDWRTGFDGVRFHAFAGEDQALMAILMHELGSDLTPEDFDDETLDDFYLKYAVSDDAEELEELPDDWGFAARVWYAVGDQIV